MMESVSGEMTRRAECYLAGVCADHIAHRLALAGLTVFRQPGDNFEAKS